MGQVWGGGPLCSSCPPLPLSPTFSGVFSQSGSLGHSAFSQGYNSFLRILPLPPRVYSGGRFPSVLERVPDTGPPPLKTGSLSPCRPRCPSGPITPSSQGLPGEGRVCTHACGAGVERGCVQATWCGAVSCWGAQGQKRGYSNAWVGAPWTIRGGKEGRKQA